MEGAGDGRAQYRVTAGAGDGRYQNRDMHSLSNAVSVTCLNSAGRRTAEVGEGVHDYMQRGGETCRGEGVHAEGTQGVHALMIHSL